AEARGTKILLPVDAVVAREFKANAANETVAIDNVPADVMILDAGPLTVAHLAEEVAKLRTLVWNGPLGAFEITPFDVGTNTLARAVAELTKAGKLRSVAGGGDTVSALRHAGVADEFSYVSTAGGAFLEWLEGKTLPGIQALTALRGIALPT
ncbi:MAG: phosphoglycerate kinase, partial [Janthinobacterium lividum]